MRRLIDGYHFLQLNLRKKTNLQKLGYEAFVVKEKQMVVFTPEPYCLQNFPGTSLIEGLLYLY